ncbi:MAG: glycosyltransferase family 39 protein [Phycisphaerae bacterium]|nr:glycosyltransferase family 39 protein [Phycisphaerae bacterium]
MAEHPGDEILRQDQHPGYPYLVLVCHKLYALFGESESLMTWVYCAQSVSLVFRLMTLVVLYFLAREFVGSQMAFWSVIPFIILPRLAHIGSDALSDWPHLFFLVSGMWLVFQVFKTQRNSIAILAGVLAGIGFLIRPECIQIVLLSVLSLTLGILMPHALGHRRKSILNLLLLCAAFAILALPYMHMKGSLFPKKHVGSWVEKSPPIAPGAEPQTPTPPRPNQYTWSRVSLAIELLAENVGETFMWFFVPGALIGLYLWLWISSWPNLWTLFVVGLLGLNVLLMIWLYCNHGYMDFRHTIPLQIPLLCCTPLGIRQFSNWLTDLFNGKSPDQKAKSQRIWFYILTISGFCICAPKLFRPIASDRKALKIAAIWLDENSRPTDIVAEPDPRVSFYSHRQGIEYKEDRIPPNVDYLVRVLSQTRLNVLDKECGERGEIAFEHIEKDKGQSVRIYRLDVD